MGAVIVVCAKSSGLENSRNSRTWHRRVRARRTYLQAACYKRRIYHKWKEGRYAFLRVPIAGWLLLHVWLGHK